MIFQARIFISALLIALPTFSAVALFAQSPIHITFEADEVGKFPSDWTSRSVSKAAEVYAVQAQTDKRFLHADAKGTSVQIGYEKKWALREFPMLQWQWRAILFPSGTNERIKDGDDSVLGVYVVFGSWPFIKSIKYIWSDTIPIGASFNSPFSSSAKLLVIRSGRALMGTWVTEKRNVFTDYLQLFGDEEKNPVASGIAILTDADNTNSHAIGDYADIQTLAMGSEKPATPKP
ncbi:MAG: DUF3047 domain-containing protein [Proteobacteria bacterium]|nr:DUF3047 domain-containing protein [Pseudomonadota bacterium]